MFTLTRVALLGGVVVDEEGTQQNQSGPKEQFEERRVDEVRGEGTDDDGWDRTRKQPLGGLVVDDALFDVRAQSIPHAENLRQEAGADCLCGGQSYTEHEEGAEKQRSRDARRERDSREDDGGGKDPPVGHEPLHRERCRRSSATALGGCRCPDKRDQTDCDGGECRRAFHPKSASMVSSSGVQPQNSPPSKGNSTAAT